MARIRPYATNSMLLGRGVAANRNEAAVYPYHFLPRNRFTVSRPSRLSVPANLRKAPLHCFRMNLPAVAPVAPTRASQMGSREPSAA